MGKRLVRIPGNNFQVKKMTVIANNAMAFHQSTVVVSLKGKSVYRLSFQAVNLNFKNQN